MGTHGPGGVAGDVEKGCQKRRNERKSKSGLSKKPKLDNARRLRGIYFIDPADEELRKLFSKAMRKLEVPMPAAMPCKIRERTNKETCHNPDAPKTKYACIAEADESTRKRLEGTLHKDHEDHIAGTGINSLNHHNLVHKSRMRKLQVKKNWKNSRKYSVATDESQKQEKGDR